MTSKNNVQHFGTLLENLRYLEAIGYLSALDQDNRFDSKKIKDYILLIRAYKQIAHQAMWNQDGVRLLYNTKDSLSNSDIIAECERLINCISKGIDTEMEVGLNFISVYYAMANEYGELFADRMKHFKSSLNKHSLNKEYEALNMKPFGGYEEVDYFSRYLAQKLNFNTLCEMIYEFSVRDVL